MASPIVAVNTGMTSDEGQLFSGPVATFSDPNGSTDPTAFQATIDWGDGSGSDSVGTVSYTDGAFQVTGSHAYAEEGNFPIQVTVLETGSDSTPASTGSGSDTFSVSDALLTLTPGNSGFQAVESTSTGSLVLATFTDPGGAEPAGNYLATIDWGDGSGNDTVGTVSLVSGNTFQVTGSHTYAEEGNYTILVTVTDDGNTPDPGLFNLTTEPMYVADAGLALVPPGSGNGSSGQSSPIIWQPQQSLPAPVQSVSAVTLNGLIYVVGGSSNGNDVATVESYNPTSNSWTTLAPLPSLDSGDAGRAGGVIGVINGKIYLAGGWRKDPTSGQPTATSTLEIYDPSANTWSTGASMPITSASAAGGVINGKLYVLSPVKVNGSYQSQLDVYNPSTNSWTKLANAPSIHREGVAGVLNGQMGVAGGMDGSGNTSSELDVYNPATNSWTVAAPMPTARWGAGIVVMPDQGMAAVAGGYTANGLATNVIELYDADSNTWTPATQHNTPVTLSAPRGELAGIALGDTVYVLGGNDGSGPVATVESLNTQGNPGAGTFQATAGTPTGPVTLASFTDLAGPETPGDYSATIDWGDGSNPNLGVIQANPDGSFSVVGNHLYTTSNTYTVAVTILHENGLQPTNDNSGPSVSGSIISTPGNGISTPDNGLEISTTDTVLVNPAVALSPNNLPADSVGIAYDRTITASNGTGTLTLKVSNIQGSIPGLNVPASGTGTLHITGKPTAAGTETFTVTATDSLGARKTTNYSIMVNPAVTLSPGSLTTSSVNIPFNQTITAKNGTGALTLTLSNIQNPITGLSIASSGSTVNITGVPTIAGTATFTVTATDSIGSTTGPQQYTVKVNPAGSLFLSPVGLLPGTVGNNYAPATITATGGFGAYSFSVTPANSLPPGMTLSKAGVVSGTPTKAGSYAFTVTATDNTKPTLTGSIKYTLVVNPALVIAPTSLPTATAGNKLSAQLTATGGSGQGYTFTAPGLPAWLTLSSSGLLSGTPPASAPSALNFTVKVTDNVGGTASQGYSLTIDPALVIKPGSLTPATVGSMFSTQLMATGGTGKGYTFSATGLPAWLTLSPAGLLSGTPSATTGSPLSITIKVSDSIQATTSINYSLTIDPALTIATTSLPVATVGNLFQIQLSARGGAGSGYSFTASGLPSGLTLSRTGLLSGTPTTAAGSPIKFSITVTDGTGAGTSQSYSLTVDPALTITPTTITGAKVGTKLSVQLTATGGSGKSYTFTATGLPSWLTLSSTGLLSGTPTSKTGSPFHFTVKVTDSNQATGSQAYTITL